MTVVLDRLWIVIMVMVMIIIIIIIIIGQKGCGKGSRGTND